MIQKLKLFHWRPYGGGYFFSDSKKDVKMIFIFRVLLAISSTLQSPTIAILLGF
jgi:hypothetical protein